MPPSRSFPRALCAALALIAAPWAGAAPPTAAQGIERSAAADWRPLVPADTLVLELADPRSAPIVIELAPRFAPRHVENIRTLAHEGFFDGLSVVRVQDNYVAQW